MKYLARCLLSVVLVSIIMLVNDAFSKDCLSKNTELLDAVEQSDYEKTLSFASSCDIKMMSSEHGLDLLDVAVRNNEIRMVKILLENGFDINQVNRYGDLSISSCQGVEMAKFLVSSGVNINYQGKRGYAPLHDLILSNKIEIARYVIKEGAMVNVKTETGSTPLMYASDKEQVSLVKLLIDHGAVLDERNNDQETALHIAVSWGSLEIVKVLVEAGADINAVDIRKETPLHLAATDGKAEIVKYLVEKGADVNRFNTQGNTPLWNAYNKRPYPGRVKNENRKEVIEILQKAGAI